MFALSMIPESAVTQHTFHTAGVSAGLYLYSIATIATIVFLVGLVSTLRIRDEDARR